MKKVSKAHAAMGAVALLVSATLGLLGCPSQPASPPPVAATSPAPATASTPATTPDPPLAAAPPPAAPASLPPVAPAPAPQAPVAPDWPSTSPASGKVGGIIMGHALAATARALAPIPNDKDVGSCGNPYVPDPVLVGPDGRLGGALVYLRGALPAWKLDPGARFELDQKQCHFTPPLLVAPAGATISIKNSDVVLHNVSWTCTLNSTGNVAVGGGQTIAATFAKPEIVPFQCSIHPFMTGLVVILENEHYGITDPSGAFALTNVPAGTYKLQGYHPLLKKAAPVQVTVVEGQTVNVDVTF